MGQLPSAWWFRSCTSRCFYRLTKVEQLHADNSLALAFLYTDISQQIVFIPSSVKPHHTWRDIVYILESLFLGAFIEHFINKIPGWGQGEGAGRDEQLFVAIML